jgi:hypothetical protein
MCQSARADQRYWRGQSTEPNRREVHVVCEHRGVSLCAGLLLAAGAADVEPVQSLGAGEGFVDIVAWPGYIERGATDPKYD